MAQIFLSYAREDIARARPLAEALAAQGWSVFWDRRIPHGRDFNVYLQSQLDDASCIVVLWSQAALASQFVRDEAAEGLNGRLVPARIEAVKPPLGFRQLQSADLIDWHAQPSHEEFQRLVESIAAIVPGPPMAKPSAGERGEQAPMVPLHQKLDVEFDVCLSFSRVDNVSSGEGQRAWVSNLGRALEIRISQLTGIPARVWLDGNHQTDDAVDPQDAKFPTCAVLVPVVSPHYVVSKPAREHLARFVAAAKAQSATTVGNNARIFKVMMTPVSAIAQPPELRTVLGYEFFTVDPVTGKMRTFDEIFGPEAQRAFWLRLDDLAHDIAETLAVLRP
jgi:hypothetical protein